MADNFRTVVPVKNPGWEIDHEDKLLLVGSCFAENIGTLLQRARFDIVVNPHGILFNPFSVAHCIRDLIQNKYYTPDELTSVNDLWVSLAHHGKYNHRDPEVTRMEINKAIEKGAEQLRNADVLIVTWGSAWAYKWKSTGTIVANCHKIPAHHFEKVLLTHDDIVEEWKSIISSLRSVRQHIKIVFTVSPVRYWRDGVNESQISKSHLLIAADTLCRELKDVFYFPAYEIVLDELRDYRFYKEDMLHPNDVAIRYIWQRFTEALFSLNTNKKLCLIEPLIRYIEHRPLHTSFELHTKLCLEKEEEIRRILS